jgi:predicted RNA-binding Zn ribbon-like protein
VSTIYFRIAGSIDQVEPACVEFVNTVRPRVGPAPIDELTDYAELVNWTRSVELVPERTARTLRRAACAEPAAAERALHEAIQLREALFVLLLALAEDRRPSQAIVSVLHRHYITACRTARLDIASGEVRWHWAEEDLGQLGGRLAVDALSAIGTPAAARLKQCPPAHGGCGWLFVDGTKNGSRRWCSMAGCGGTVKARRQAAKRRAERRSGLG